MKKLCIFLIGLLPVVPLSANEQKALPFPKGESKDVVVRILGSELPKDPESVETYLQDNFFNKPDEQQFSHFRTNEWKDVGKAFATTLVAKAKKQNLPYAALGKAIETILSERGNLAVIPVGAYLTKLSGYEAWIIVCKWEEDGQITINPLDSPFKNEKKESYWPFLGHIRVFVYYTTDNKLGAFTTCL